MAVEVKSRNCAAVSDSDFAELADLCAQGPNPFSVGLLSKQAELWVLLTEARENGKLRGFTFSTLERIGGTPAIILGAGSVARMARRGVYLRDLLKEQLHRALMAFPDEDVLVGVRLNSPSGYEAFEALSDLMPRPGHAPNGEERAWGRQLAKLYNLDNNSYDARSFVATGNGTQPAVLDHCALKPESIPDGLEEIFSPLDVERGDSLLATAWAPAGLLSKYQG